MKITNKNNFSKKKLLIVGGIPDEKYHCRYGGTTVLMQNFLTFLNRQPSIN